MTLDLGEKLEPGLPRVEAVTGHSLCKGPETTPARLVRRHIGPLEQEVSKPGGSHTLVHCESCPHPQAAPWRTSQRMAPRQLCGRGSDCQEDPPAEEDPPLSQASSSSLYASQENLMPSGPRVGV